VSDCGVQFIDLGWNPIAELSVDLLRQLVYRRFLVANEEYVDRVLVADLFDTLFQKDPFTEYFQRDRVYYSDEGYPIGAESSNRYWVRELLPMVEAVFGVENITDGMKGQIFKHTIVNGGLMGGGLRPFLEHLEFMMKMGNLVTLRPLSTDQGFLNVGLALGFASFRYQIDPPNSTFLGSVGVLIRHHRRHGAVGRVLGQLSRDGRIPNVLHQYPRSPVLINMPRRACPGPFSHFRDYVGENH
jgi:hypothetical protein